MKKSTEPLMIGIPEVDQARFGAIALLRKAEIPVRDFVGYSFSQQIWFDSYAQAVRRPTDEQKVNLVEVSTAPAGALRKLVTSGVLDMAIRERRVPLDRDRPDTLRLAIPGRTRAETLTGELILAEPIDPEVLEQVRKENRLKGIEGFRNRLVASLVRASEESIQQAFIASLEGDKKRANANYQAMSEGERPYLPY